MDPFEGELTEKQWKILESATKIFAEKGFEKSRTADIAKEAGVAEGTIFRYYKTKKDLLLGLVVPLIVKFFRPIALQSVESIMESRGSQPVDELLTQIYIDRMELINQNFSLIKTLMIESNYHPELLETIRSEIVPQIVAAVDRMTEGYVKDGTFRDIEPRRLTRMIISQLLGYVMLTKGVPRLFSFGNDEDELKGIVDMALHGILRNPREEEK